MITSFDHQKTFITKSIYFSALYVNLIRLTLINLLNISIQAKSLEYTNFFGNFVYKNGITIKMYGLDWIVYNGSGVTNICGTTQIFGGCNSFYTATTIIKNIQLPCHQTLSFNFRFWHLDNWGNERLEVIVDNRLVFTGQYSSESSKPSICCTSGSAYGDDVNSVNIDIDHLSEFATIKIIGYEYYWGISDFQIWVGQQNCFLEDCVHGCNNCIRGNCVECQEEWEYDILQQTCFPLCGDQIIIDNEECDDGNQQEHDGCFQCKFSCPLFCKQCKFGQCLQCQSNYMLIDQTCKETNEVQDQKSQNKFSIQISNFLDYGNYGKNKNEIILKDVSTVLQVNFYDQFYIKIYQMINLLILYQSLILIVICKHMRYSNIIIFNVKQNQYKIVYLVQWIFVWNVKTFISYLGIRKNAFLNARMELQCNMNFVMIRIIYNLMDVINARQVANQNAKNVQNNNAMYVLMDGKLLIINVIKSAEMVCQRFLQKNNVTMETIILMMDVMIVNLYAIKTVSNVLLLTFVFYVLKISKWMRIIYVNQYAAMESLYKDQKNVKILMIFHMMVAINVCFNVNLIVLNVCKVFVKNARKDMIYSLRDAKKQSLLKKLMIQNNQIKHNHAEMENYKIQSSVMMEIQKIMMVVQVVVIQRNFGFVIQNNQVHAIQKLNVT